VADQKCQIAAPLFGVLLPKYSKGQMVNVCLRLLKVVLRHMRHILLFEYVNMRGQKVHIQLLEYNRRPIKQARLIGGKVLYSTGR